MRFTLALLLVAVLTGCSAEPQSAEPLSDEDAIRECFEGYNRAISSRDGSTAIDLLDRRTLNHYERLRDLSIHEKAEAVRSLPTTEKLFVLMVRHQLPAATLERMDGKALLAHAVEEGWINPNKSDGGGLGEVSVSGEYAVGALLFEDGTTSYDFEWVFRKEAGRWKLDLTAALATVDEELKRPLAREARRTGKTEDELILDILLEMTGNRPKDTIWEPLAE